MIEAGFTRSPYRLQNQACQTSNVTLLNKLSTKIKKKYLIFNENKVTENLSLTAIHNNLFNTNSEITMNILWRQGRITHYVYRVIYQEIRPLSSLHVSCLYNTLGTRTEAQSLKAPNLSYSVIRFMSKKRKDEDSDDEAGDVFDDDLSLTKDSKIVKLNTTSLRMDAILKSTLGVARNKIEKLFYESKIRVNGRKILKKSIPVRVDYEIDVIKSVSPKNPDHLYVARVEILSIAAKEDSIAITARRFKNLLIENYETDPYKASTADEDK